MAESDKQKLIFRIFVSLIIAWLSLPVFSQQGYVHRGYLGWIGDLSRTEVKGDWPSIEISKNLVADYEETLDFLNRSDMSELTMWGFFTNKYWEPEVETTIDSARAQLVRELIRKAHEKNIRIICGLGVYSWGFNKIIATDSSVKCPCNPQIMDLNAVNSWMWQKKVIDYIIDNFNFDGFSLQSADLGICSCSTGRSYTPLEYHAVVNQKVVSYIRSRRPQTIIGISGWGMDFSDPAELENVKSMTYDVDYLIDVGESAELAGVQYKKKLIEAIKPCTYGSTATPNVEPIQNLPRDFYFVPTVFHTGERLKKLYSEGGRASETYVRTRGNPGDEITVEVAAKVLKNPGMDLEKALEEAITSAYKPKDRAALKKLVNVYQKAEYAFFKAMASGSDSDQYKDIILLMLRDQLVPESTYLKSMSASGLGNYIETMQSLLKEVSSLRNKVGNIDKLELTQKCFTKVITAALLNLPSDPVISVYSSSPEGDRLTCLKDLHFATTSKPSLTAIRIDETTHFQGIDGFGASFNEAGMICLNSLAPSSRDSVLRMLFDPETGAGYTLMKSPIGACDFASAGPWYTYNDTPGDTLMKHFSIDRDLGPGGLIPFIKQARRFGSFEIEAPMDFAPDWMYYGMQKKIQKNIKPVYYNALADYYLKYIEAYAENGVSIDNLVLFNESFCDTCESHGYSTVPYKDIGLLIHNYVVPRLKANNLKTKIILGESCFRYSAIESYPVVLDNPSIRKEISKVAVHGYDFDKYSSIAAFREKYPDVPIWMTEICYVKPPVYEFSDGEYWGNMIMNDINNGVSGWIYWNMILDQDGGPWLTSPLHGDPDNNHQHPVVIINRETHKVTYTGLYYYLSHFSKFVRPGACRIKCEGGNSQLNFAGFLNKDGSIVINVINNGEVLDCNLTWKGKVVVQRLKAHSVTTFTWKH